MLKSRAVKFVTVSGIACAAVLGGTSAFADSSYTVRSGDNLSKIASGYGETWQQLQNVNHLRNPNLIYPGERINIASHPSATPGKTGVRPIGPAKPSKPIAIPVPSTSDGVNWAAVAQCESSGDWSINTGNGYYGGLQFSESTWRAYGGAAYAPYANEATEGQQIAIADKVLHGQGIGAWPVCGKRG